MLRLWSEIISFFIKTVMKMLWREISDIFVFVNNRAADGAPTEQ